MNIERIAQQVAPLTYEIPTTYKQGMLVPARIIGNAAILSSMDEGVVEQITNVACLPGIQTHALCMPDGHWGYGFPIGGVAAFDTKKGIISPGGIGFDINCGMRLITTHLTRADVQPKLKELIDHLFKTVPAGTGRKGFFTPTKDQLDEILCNGAKFCIDKGFGWPEDLLCTEDYGCLKDADASKVSQRAKDRGQHQLGTLGSGNHYLEIQTVAGPIADTKRAHQFGITRPDQILVMFHCGSRGLGHQVGSDYLKRFSQTMTTHGITVKDAQLACAPFASSDGQDYFKAMAAAANFAFANRQLILHRIREAFAHVFGRSAQDLGMHMVYDVAHNIAKREQYIIEGKKKEVIVHRKGATRSCGPGNPVLPKRYQQTGQPVIIGGSMETGSWLLAGTKKAEELSFASTSHGAGRALSRAAAKKRITSNQLQGHLRAQGIYVRSTSLKGLSEEAGIAYKNVADVIDSVHEAGLSEKVTALKPLGNVKG